MNKLIAVIFAAMFAAVSFQAVAQDKKPTAEQCKKDPKMKGCERLRRRSKRRTSEERRGESPPFLSAGRAC